MRPVEIQNVTLALPKDLLMKARRRAAERGTSLSALLTDQLREALKDDPRYEAAQRRIRQRLRKGFDLGTQGNLRVPREDLHGR